MMPRPFFVLLAGLVSTAPAPAVLAGEAPARAEVRLHEGTLPNGLRYVILPHASLKADASLHLVVRAGSLDENDDERGFAHFVEHMAFSGTKNYPPSSIRVLMQRLGMAFGAHLNAGTGYDRTDYRLDIQRADASKLDEGLAVLRDFADGILFEFSEVMRESGVVVSELKTRDSAAQRNSLLNLNALYEGTALPQRAVIGVQEQLERATPEKLAAFYQRNYLPGRMTVIVVGAVEPAPMSQKIASVFGSMATPAVNTPPAPVPEIGKTSSTKPLFVQLSQGTAATTEFTHIRPRPPSTVEGRKQMLLHRLATVMLNTRMRVRVSGEAPGEFGVAMASYGISIGNLVHHTVRVTTAADTWANAVDLAEPELRRARTEGFTVAEVTEVVSGYLASLRNRTVAFSSLPAARIAAEITAAIASGSTWLTPAEELAEATQTLEGVTPAQFQAAVNEIFPADETRLVITAPASARAAPERSLAALKKSQGRALRKRTEEKPLVFKYQDFGEPGAVAKRDEVPEIDLTLVSFANDVRLNMRPSFLEPEQFRLRIVFPQNLSHVPTESGGIAELAGAFLTNANPRRHNENEMTRLVRLNDVTRAFSVPGGTPTLNLSGPSSSLPFALQFLTALLSDLNLDDDSFTKALGRYGANRNGQIRTAQPLAQREALYVFTGDDKRVSLRTPQVMAGQRNEVQGWLQKNILNGPLEIGLVGDFNVEEALKTAAATVGTLKKRRPLDPPGAPLAWPKKAERRETLAELSTSTATAAILWPVALPETPRNTAALNLATDIFRDRMFLILRESLGANYATSARLHRDTIQRDFAFIELLATFDADKARDQTMGTIRVASQLAERGVLKEEFERLREPARARAATDMLDNNWWLVNVVTPAQRRPASIETGRIHDKVYDEVTLEEVNTAARVFRSELSTAVIVKSNAAAKKK